MSQNQNNSKILVVGGTHGNEYTGIDLVRYLQKNPIAEIDQIIANIPASELNLRFVETNLQNSFGVKYPISTEEIRAVEISRILPNYDLIIDFHNTIDQNMTCGIITCQPNRLHLEVCQVLGITKIIQFPPGNTLIGQNSIKSISIEISNSDMKEFSVDKLHKNLIEMSKFSFEQKDLKVNVKKNIEFYKFVRNLPKSTFDRLLPSLGYLYNFVALDAKQKEILKLPSESDIYPVFRGSVSHFTNGLLCSFVEKI